MTNQLPLPLSENTQQNLTDSNIKNYTCIVSFSGGQTSAYLTWIMLQAAKRYGFKLLVIY